MARKRNNNSSNATPTTDDLIRFVDHWRARRIVVVGDFMLDRYVYGDAERLSPDAPVPVLSVKSLTDEGVRNHPGGAGNVCAMLRGLGCDVQCFGVVGDDTMADMLLGELKQRGCRTGGLVRAKNGRRTTVKFNIVGLAQHRHAQKMFRIDVEDREPIDEALTKRLLGKLEKAIKGAAALCLEDYNKGVLTPRLCEQVIQLAHKHRVPVLVDPAAIDDYRKYRAATCITPNRTEAQAATAVTGANDEAVEQMARKLLRQLELEAIVITLDRHGALLSEKGRRPTVVPTIAREVYDVTGAGDMVLAMLAAARANGADWRTAVELANVGAGLEVAQFGVVPVELDEVLLALLRRKHETVGKLRTLDELLPELNAYRKAGRRIAFTNGCFDILHAGHVAYLRQARQRGDLLVVGLNSDDSIRRIKGDDRPVNRQADRVMVLSELASIDYIVVFDDDTPTKLLEAIRPDVLVKGGDYTHDQVVGAGFVESYGGRVELVPPIKGRSTTNIIRKISKRP